MRLSTNWEGGSLSLTSWVGLYHILSTEVEFPSLTTSNTKARKELLEYYYSEFLLYLLSL